MHKLINTIASSAAVVTLMAGLWQDWNLLTTLKRMFIAYLASFFLGCLMALAVKLVPAYEKNPEPKKPESREPVANKNKARESAPVG